MKYFIIPMVNICYSSHCLQTSFQVSLAFSIVIELSEQSQLFHFFIFLFFVIILFPRKSFFCCVKFRIEHKMGVIAVFFVSR